MTEFIYEGKKYSTWNLRKELKKMGIDKKDVQIVQEDEKKQPEIVPETEKRRAIVHWDPKDNTTEWGFGKPGEKTPKPLEGKAWVAWLKEHNLLWDPVKKIGMTSCGKYWTEEYVMSLVLLKGRPKFPIVIGEDGLPILEEVYEDWE